MCGFSIYTLVLKTPVRGMLNEPQGEGCHMWLQQSPCDPYARESLPSTESDHRLLFPTLCSWLFLVGMVAAYLNDYHFFQRVDKTLQSIIFSC